MEIPQLFLAVAIQHQTVAVTALQPSLIALEAAAHEMNIAGLEVQVCNALALQLHRGITTEHVLVKRDCLPALIPENDVRYKVRHRLSSSPVLHTSRPYDTRLGIVHMKDQIHGRLEAEVIPRWPRPPDAQRASATVTACGAAHCACRSGSGSRSPSRSKPAPVSATARAPPHQTASGDVASSAPPTAGPRATPAVKLRL